MKRSGRRGAPSLPAPHGLSAYTFDVDKDEYAVLAFPMPDMVLPNELTAAEKAVARQVIEGLSNLAIARQRRTSVNTIANQVRSIYAKLRVSSRTELMRRCAATPHRDRGRGPSSK